MKNKFNRAGYVSRPKLTRPLTTLETDTYTVVKLPPAAADGAHEITDQHVMSNALYSNIGNIRGSKVA